MNTQLVDIKLNEVVFDETIYPRAKHDPAKVQEYLENLKTIEDRGNYISIDAQNRLLDGRHRHLAYIKLADGAERTIKAYQYDDSIDSRLVSIRLNSTHGQQLSTEDKRRDCISLYSAGYTLETILAELSITYDFAQKSTKNIRDEEEKQRREKMYDMWLACYTDEEIASKIEQSQSVVSRKTETFVQIIENNNLHKSRAFFMEEAFAPPV